MTPFQEELSTLIREIKQEINAFTTESQDTADSMQRILMFSNRWDYKDKYENLEKEYEETKSKFEKERSIIALQTTKTLLKEIIPIIDDFFVLEKFAEKGSSLEKGIKLILINLEKLLMRRKGSIIRPQIGENADPIKHRFVEAEEVDGHQGTTISEVYRYGYTVLDQIVREAEVKVKCCKVTH